MSQEISNMKKEQVLEKVKLLLLRLMKISKEEEAKNLKWDLGTDIFSDIGVDSVDAIDFMYAIEAELGIKLNLNEAKLRRTLGDVVDLIIESAAEKKQDG